MCMTRNTNICLYEQLVNIIQIFLKFIFKTGGSYNLIFASFRSRYFFKRDKTKESSIYAQNSWTMDLFGPFVIDKMRAQFKLANTIHVLLFIINVHVPIIVSFNLRTTHQPRFYNQCHPRPSWDLRNPMHWNQGRSRALTPNAYENGSGLGKTYLTFYGNFFYFFLLVAEFSALRQNMLS